MYKINRRGVQKLYTRKLPITSTVPLCLPIPSPGMRVTVLMSDMFRRQGPAAAGKRRFNRDIVKPLENNIFRKIEINPTPQIEYTISKLTDRTKIK